MNENFLKFFAVATVGLLIDGRMGVSRERAERIRRALAWKKGAQLQEVKS